MTWRRARAHLSTLALLVVSVAAVWLVLQINGEETCRVVMPGSSEHSAVQYTHNCNGEKVLHQHEQP